MTLASLLCLSSCGADAPRAAADPDAGLARRRDADSGASEAGADSGGSASSERFGAECRTDDDCGGSLRCLGANADDLAPGLGGPPHGMCSKGCIVSDDCGAPLEAVCASPFDGGPTFCLPACTPGKQPSSRYKCLGRLDLACQAMAGLPAPGACVPACGGSGDCEGRICDLGTGVCTDHVRPGLPIGADCSSATCASGMCVDIDGFSTCSGTCTLGTVSCGFDPSSPSRLDADCALSPGPNAGDGDLGLCAQLCDCDSDCRRAGFVCEPGPADSLLVLSARGRRGLCRAAQSAAAHRACRGDAGTADAGTADAGTADAGTADAAH